MRICIQTLGCKVNQYETQALEALLSARGHLICTPEEECDVFIINTCAVTAESGRKSRQMIRRFKEGHPNALIAVCGCYSQISPKDVETLHVNLVAGSGDRRLFIENLERLIETGKSDHIVGDPMKRRKFEELPAGSLSGRTRAMLKIQDGCDNFCTYCIIPYARGPVRSLPLEKAVSEAARLASAGYSELIITGIEISSYGKDFKDGTSLIDAIERISKAAPNMRLRLGSLEPRTVSEEFCRLISALPNVCGHFHLSLQSGCDETLLRMKRKYDTADFYKAVGILRRYFPDCGITADLIVGFPGETEAEFAKTLEFIQICAFSSMHIFPYSIRPGTQAAELPGQIDKKTKQERARKASQIASEMERRFLEKCVGKTLGVLFESENNGISAGHAGNYCLVETAATGIRNAVLPIHIETANGDRLFGKITNTNV